MSSALVRQALLLFEDDVEAGSSKVANKQRKKDPMKLIGTEKKGVKKKLRKLEALRVAERSKKAKGVGLKCAVDVYRRNLPLDHTQDNLHMLHQLSQGGKTDSKSTETILCQHRGPLSKNKPDVHKEDTSTVFSDRDFDEFAKEYFS